MKLMKILIVGVLLAVLIAACGLKGPLYIPPPETPATEAQTDPESEEEDGSQA